MKQSFLCLFFAISLVFVTQAQTDSTLKKQTIHGVVKNEKGRPIQNATVFVEGEETGTATDSLGYFRIDARPDAVLVINAEGYESLMQPVNKEELINAVMVKSRDETDNTRSNEIQKQQALNTAFQDFSKTESGSLYHGTSLPVIHEKEDTRGSRYLFKDWVKGTVINDKGTTISDPFCFFNYDKIAHALLVTKDRKNMIQVDYDNIGSFTLKDQQNEYSFEKIPSISPKDFFTRLSKAGGKYVLYKSIKTHFEKSDYRSDGLVEFGKNYDEYVDEYKYYVVTGDGKQPASVIPVELKKKAIKQAMPGEEAKVSAYMSQHKDDAINETFLVGLVNSLNQ